MWVISSLDNFPFLSVCVVHTLAKKQRYGMSKLGLKDAILALVQILVKFHISFALVSYRTNSPPKSTFRKESDFVKIILWKFCENIVKMHFLCFLLIFCHFVLIYNVAKIVKNERCRSSGKFGSFLLKYSLHRRQIYHLLMTS